MDQASRKSLYEVITIDLTGVKISTPNIRNKEDAQEFYKELNKGIPEFFSSVLLCTKTPCFTGGNVDPDLY